MQSLPNAQLQLVHMTSCLNTHGRSSYVHFSSLPCTYLVLMIGILCERHWGILLELYSAAGHAAPVGPSAMEVGWGCAACCAGAIRNSAS